MPLESHSPQALSLPTLSTYHDSGEGWGPLLPGLSLQGVVPAKAGSAPPPVGRAGVPGIQGWVVRWVQGGASAAAVMVLGLGTAAGSNERDALGALGHLPEGLRTQCLQTGPWVQLRDEALHAHWAGLLLGPEAG